VGELWQGMSSQKSLEDATRILTQQDWERLDTISIKADKSSKSMETLLGKLPAELTTSMEDKVLCVCKKYLRFIY